MNCPHCQYAFSQKSAKVDVFFELCSRCGSLWMDFGQTRPKLHQAVEAQVARWERTHHADQMQARLHPQVV